MSGKAMKIKPMWVWGLVIGAALGCAAALTTLAAAPSQGVVTLKLTQITAVKQNGSPDPGSDAACREQLSQPGSQYLGLSVTTRYAIDTQSQTVYATSTFASVTATPPQEVSVELHALGLSDSYAFGRYRPDNVPGVYGVLFSLNRWMGDPASRFIVFGPEGKDYNCVIASAH